MGDGSSADPDLDRAEEPWGGRLAPRCSQDGVATELTRGRREFSPAASRLDRTEGRFWKRAMKSVETFEVAAHLFTLLDQIERGEQIVITKHGRAIARLVPVGAVDRAGLADTVARLKALARAPRLGHLAAKALIEEGLR